MTIVTEHVHDKLTEPVLSRHLHDEHNWAWLDIYRVTYFQALVAHQRHHRKIEMRSVAS